MKNFIHMTALEYEEASLEGFLEVLARRFMDTYEQAERIELNGREVPFARRTEQSFQSASAATTPSPSSRSTATGRSSTAAAARGSGS